MEKRYNLSKPSTEDFGLVAHLFKCSSQLTRLTTGDLLKKINKSNRISAPLD